MTWVVAHANPLAVVMLSDIRISVRDGDNMAEIAEFGVLKIHNVAPTVFAGFAGNVVLGFRLIDHLDLWLQEAYDPDVSTIVLAEQWASCLPAQFSPHVSPELADQPVELIIAGMHLAPVQGPDGNATDERLPFGSGCRMRLSRPGSGVAETARFGWSSGGVSIGSGSAVPSYVSMLNEIKWIELSQWDASMPLFASIMSRTIQETPTLGVSSEMQAMLMKNQSGGIVGSGFTLGELASDPSLIASDEDQLAELWARFRSDGSALLHAVG